MCFSCQGLDHYALECQSKTIMILRNDEEVESAIDEFECESTPQFENTSDECVEYLVEKEELLVK